ncbi:MAG TPA: LUD domain-containing protein [Spirochaetota bacterium]|nr:LUD domain-containing protein [Spirochaetota bacterium]
MKLVKGKNMADDRAFILNKLLNKNSPDLKKTARTAVRQFYHPQFDRPARQEVLALFRSRLTQLKAEFIPVNSMQSAGREINKLFAGQTQRRLAVSSPELQSDLNTIVSRLDSSFKVMDVTRLDAAQRKKQTAGIDTALVRPVWGLADTGTLVFFYDKSGSCYPHFLTDTVIAFLKAEDIIKSQFELFSRVDKEELKNIFMMAGPSRTADIEKIVFLGAHGPRRLIVLLLA